MPNQPKPGTRNRSFRVEDALWNRASVKARREGRTVGDVLREMLALYVEGEGSNGEA